VAAALVVPVLLLCVGSYMNATGTIPYFVSLAVGRPGIAVSANALAAVVVLPMTALLVWKLGLLGAGLAWVLYQAFLYAYSVPRLCAECLELPTRRWYAHVVTIAALGLATYGVAAAVCLAVVPEPGLPARALAYLVATPLFSAGALKAMTPETRAMLVDRWRARAAAAGAAAR
jgi:O-antigen/teichoic acid export membrane protein